MPRRYKTTRSEENRIQRRLISCIPASRFEMQTLSRLADIRTTRDLPTAAVECTRNPRLLLNPDFIDKYCQRDEHLFLLVMHELLHVQLAHTRMYPRMNQAQNIAFDAIINSALMRQFNAPEYMGFFDVVNPADQFPSCLLRPPVGWPDNPQYPDDIGPPGTARIIRQLYPPKNARRTQPPLYEEVQNLLLKAGMMKMPCLLGNHDGEPIHDPYMKEIMREISQHWPEIPIGQGRGAGGNLTRRTPGFRPTNDETRAVFSQVLQKALGPILGQQQRQARMPVPGDGVKGVMPNPRDRMSHARKKLGVESLIWNQPGTTKAKIRERPSKSYVYLDVSGSMNFVLAHLLHLLLPYVSKGYAEAFQFSTEIKALPLPELKEGRIATTGGTEINCVLEHLVNAEPPIKRALILTDGEVGHPKPHLAQQIQERDLRLYVVLPHRCRLDEGVAEIAAAVIYLPPMQ